MSNIIKNSQYISADSYRVLSQTQAQALAAEVVSNQQEALSEELEQQRERLFQQEQELQEQQQQLLELREQMLAGIDELRQNAQLEIEKWWSDRRGEDQKAIEHAKKEGIELGKKDGFEKGLKEANVQLESTLAEAAELLQQAEIRKKEIIAAAEPFLVEMSTMIAEKIITKQLSIQPNWIVELIRAQLSRKANAPSVTILVSQSQFSTVYASRESLMGCLDPMAELMVIPDPHIHDQGCVIRTPGGSMDCTVDTQLKAIQAALQQVAWGGAGDETP